MSNHSQIMEAGPSTPIVVFQISHGAIRREQNVRHPDRLRRCSLGLRRLMDNQVTNEILLELDSTSCIDCAAAAWVLDNLQRQQLDVRPDPRTLATHCAILWKYKCIPDPFKSLGESMHPRSSSASLTNGDHQSSMAPSTSPSRSSRCWGGKKNSETCSQLITIAFVLGLQEILEDEIRTAVWGTSKKMNFAADLGFDIEAIRKNELQMLFDSVFYRLFEINDENEKLAKSIREILKKRHLGNFSKRWPLNAAALKDWTPHDFLRGIENALSAPEPEMHSRETRTPAGPKDLPHINWPNLVRKATKGTFPAATGKKSGGDQEKKDAILEELERLVDERRRQLTLELITERNMKVQAWQDELDRLERNNE